MNYALSALKTALPIDSVGIAAFIKRHWRPSRWTPREDLLAWVNWYLERDLVAVVTERGKIAAVGMARGCDDPCEARDDHWHHIDKGLCMWLTLIVATNQNYIARCFEQAMDRFSAAKLVAFQRIKNGREIKIYPTHRFYRALTKLLTT